MKRKSAITHAHFKLFLVIWNQQMGMSTPAHHIKIAHWLESRWKSGDKRLLLMAFRSAGKSTIVGLFAAWLLYQNPNLRVLVLAADLALATKMVRNVKRIIEKHPLSKHLKPDKVDQWGAERFTLKRTIELRDPSMMAKGIHANITGSRADIIICDDVEVPNTADSADKRQALRERLGEMNYVLLQGGSILYVGTPHSYYTIYAEQPREEVGEDEAFLADYQRMLLPLLDDVGQCNWPERYSKPAIEKLKRDAGPNRFASQMMLKPINIAEGRLNPDLLVPYDQPLDYTPELGSLFIGGKKMVSASAFWDPSYGSAKGDKSVLAIIFADEGGRLYLHKLAFIEVDENSNVDAATQQCALVAKHAKEHYLPSLTVETNGLGKFLPSILRNELVKARAPCTVIEKSQTQNKEQRILEAFDALMAAKLLSVRKQVLKTSFITEMQEWRPVGGSKYRDDSLDAVAGALAQQPCRLHRLHKRGSLRWMDGANAHRAKTDYDV